MIDFALDDNGDVIIENEKIKTIGDDEQLCQKVKQLLNTNTGEWWLNKQEGIDFHAMLSKNPNFEHIENNIASGLHQVDPSLELLSCVFDMDNNRRLNIKIKIRKSDTVLSVEL